MRETEKLKENERKTDKAKYSYRYPDVLSHEWIRQGRQPSGTAHRCQLRTWHAHESQCGRRKGIPVLANLPSSQVVRLRSGEDSKSEIIGQEGETNRKCTRKNAAHLTNCFSLTRRGRFEGGRDFPGDSPGSPPERQPLTSAAEALGPRAGATIAPLPSGDRQLNLLQETQRERPPTAGPTDTRRCRTGDRERRGNRRGSEGAAGGRPRSA